MTKKELIKNFFVRNRSIYKGKKELVTAAFHEFYGFDAGDNKRRYIRKCYKEFIDEMVATPVKDFRMNLDSWMGDETPAEWKKYLVLSDLHFPFQCEDTLQTISKYAKEEGLDNLVLLGDIFDFYEISNFTTKFAMSFEDEVDKGVSRLKEFMNTQDWKHKVFIKGNHEDRMERYITQNARKIQNLLESRGFTLSAILGLDDLGFNFVDNIKLRAETGSFYKIGKLNLIHGHEIRGGGFTYPADGKLRKCHDNIMFGHIHKTAVSMPEFDLDGVPKRAWSIGCGCDLYPEYMPHNMWNHGFGEVWVRDDGHFRAYSKMVYKGEVM